MNSSQKIASLKTLSSNRILSEAFFLLTLSYKTIRPKKFGRISFCKVLLMEQILCYTAVKEVRKCYSCPKKKI